MRERVNFDNLLDAMMTRRVSSPPPGFLPSGAYASSQIKPVNHEERTEKNKQSNYHSTSGPVSLPQ